MYLKNDEDETSHPEFSRTDPSGSTDNAYIQVSYHIRTSDVLAHLQSDQVGLLKADTAVDQQERPHKAGEKKNNDNNNKKKTTTPQRHLLVIWRML